MDQYNFQYCQKIVVFSKDVEQVLLCKRKGENDYDGVFSFIGGKMEITDESIIAGLQREKNEEVGENFKIKVYPTFTTNAFFRKKDGSSMILPHYYAQHFDGEIELNEEYSEYKWIKIEDLENFEPKIPNISEIIITLLRLRDIFNEKEFVLI
jgi:ADP-ribose pyrophosphatase YjhB (NUDIX family)